MGARVPQKRVGAVLHHRRAGAGSASAPRPNGSERLTSRHLQNMLTMIGLSSPPVAHRRPKAPIRKGFPSLIMCS